jgi:hypothetical protein
MTRDSDGTRRAETAWDEINAQPLKAAPAWTKLTIGCDPIKPPERIGKTMRLRGEPPCPLCGNKTAWHCECETETPRDGSGDSKSLPVGQ